MTGASKRRVVLRVFRHFADGTALKKIASMLNEEGIAAPNDGERGNKRGHGCERRIANLTEAPAKDGWSESLGNKLRAEEILLSA
jgi:hypothetical protein